MQDGMVDIRQGDIIANLPYHPNCSLWFDHHVTNKDWPFKTPIVAGKGGFRLAPSAARVVYEYYTTVASAAAQKSKIQNCAAAESARLGADGILARRDRQNRRRPARS